MTLELKDNRKKIVTESVLSYNIPQGMVRGANLELLDITYDGSEDHLTGYLRGGVGQLVDGKYGLDNFKATGKNGVVKGERKSCGKTTFCYYTDF